MADKVTKNWGALTLTKTLIAASDTSVSATDKEQVFKLTTIDCFPAPQSTTEYVKPGRIPATVKPNSLQSSEKVRFRRLKQLFGGKPSTSLGMQAAIETKLGLDSMLISYSGKAYKKLRKLHPCFTNDIYLRVKYSVFEIKVSALRKVAVGTDTFAAGDEIITYRVREADQYRFEAHLNWNPKCCERKPAEVPDMIPTDYFAAISEAEIEEIIVTGKRLKSKAGSAKPVPVFPREEYEFDFGLGYRYRLNEPEFDFDWSKILDEDD